MWGISRYQWLVLLAAWLGWGFDVFDALLFNYVAPNCIPSLLHLPVGSPEARIQTQHWTGVITSLLLLGWAAGGVLFGTICDRFGRMRTLMLTMLLYAVGTAACAAATNLWMLAAFRVDRQPRHWRRVGRRLGDGGGGHAGESARGGRGAAVHRGAVRPVPGDVRQLPGRRGLVRQPDRALLALRVPVRPAAGGLRLRGAAVRARARALAVGQGAQSRAGARDLHAGTAPLHRQRHLHGRGGADRLVDLQRLHPGHRHRAGPRRRRAARPRCRAPRRP